MVSDLAASMAAYLAAFSATAASHSALFLVTAAASFALIIASFASGSSNSLCGADIGAESAVRAAFDLVIGSKRGLAGAALELRLIVNSSESVDLEDLLD